MSNSQGRNLGRLVTPAGLLVCLASRVIWENAVKVVVVGLFTRILSMVTFIMIIVWNIKLSRWNFSMFLFRISISFNFILNFELFNFKTERVTSTKINYQLFEYSFRGCGRCCLSSILQG